MVEFTIEKARKIVADEYRDCEIVEESVIGDDEYLFELRPKEGESFALTIDAHTRLPLVVPVD